MPEVELIDLEGGVVYLSHGGCVHIDRYFDGDGEDCDPCDAVSIVAGPWTDAHYWLAFEVGPEAEVVLH